ncbi:hypothetical protein EMIT0347P_140082 [Pseudomonas sp. IT-347P]
MLDVVKSLISLHVSPIRHALYPMVSHFLGGVSGVSLISNANVNVEMLLSMFKENSLISPIGIFLLNTILKNLLPSISFQYFISVP